MPQQSSRSSSREDTLRGAGASLDAQHPQEPGPRPRPGPLPPPRPGYMPTLLSESFLPLSPWGILSSTKTPDSWLRTMPLPLSPAPSCAPRLTPEFGSIRRFCPGRKVGKGWGLDCRLCCLIWTG